MHSGAPDRNQNARQHGWTSARNPAPISAILAAADTAANNLDVDLLRKCARALSWRGEHLHARTVRQMLAAAEVERANNAQFALSDTESVQNNLAEQIAPANSHRADTAIPAGQDRHVRGYRPSRGQGTFPY